jgi:hypothetical protein
VEATTRTHYLGANVATKTQIQTETVLLEI